MYERRRSGAVEYAAGRRMGRAQVEEIFVEHRHARVERGRSVPDGRRAAPLDAVDALRAILLALLVFRAGWRRVQLQQLRQVNCSQLMLREELRTTLLQLAVPLRVNRQQKFRLLDNRAPQSVTSRPKWHLFSRSRVVVRFVATTEVLDSIVIDRRSAQVRRHPSQSIRNFG